MRYIDAGYLIALTVLAAYAVQLWQRRLRLERRAAPPRATAATRVTVTPGTSPASERAETVPEARDETTPAGTRVGA